MKSIEKQVLELIEKHLSDKYLFHNIEHTKEVVKDAERLGKLEKVGKEDLKLLKLAALFHDTGYVFSCENHEVFSCDIAEEFLTHHGFKKREINKIKKLIMATRMDYKPKNILEKIIKDADLSYLGKKSFMKKADLFRRELILVKRIFYTDEEWYEKEIEFLETHEYYTKSAKKLWDKGKKANLNRLKRILEEVKKHL